MKILGRDISFFTGKAITKELQDLRVRVESQDKQLTQAAVWVNSMRPVAEFMNTNYGGVQMHRFPYPLAEARELMFVSDTLFTIINSRTKAVFRNGYEQAPAFVRKCPECLTEYQSENKKCDYCDVKTKEPDEQQRKDMNILYNAFMTKINANDQTLQDIHEPCDIDLNSLDDMYMLILFDYTYNVRREITYKKPREVIRADPIMMQIIADATGRLGFDERGLPFLFCPEHRYMRQVNTEVCQVGDCGTKLVQAAYVAMNSYALDTSKPIFYMRDEVVHRNKFHKSMTYGASPIRKVWRKVHALMAMDRYIQKYYQDMGIPRGAVIFDTNDMIGLKAQLDNLKDKKDRNPAEMAYLGQTRVNDFE